MISSRIDTKNNILYLTVTGTFTKENVTEALIEFISKCSKMRDGYFIINDMSLMQTPSMKNIEILFSASKKISTAKDIGKVIRILPEKEGLKEIFKKYDTKYELNDIYYAKNKKEAFDLRLKV